MSNTVMSKQDRQGVRTPADLEQKYDLGQIGDIGQNYKKQEEQLKQLSQTTAMFATLTNAAISQMEKDLYFVNEASGTSGIHLSDASGGQLKDLHIYGRSTQNGPDTFYNVENPTLHILDEMYENEQVLELPYVLRGVPVSDGGNYTDESGQQWLCDEIDFAKGLFIQRTGIYENFTLDVPEHENNPLDLIGSYISTTGELSEGATVIFGYADGREIVEALPDAVMEAFKTLHTYKPITHIRIESEAFTKVVYVADYKAYVDNKVAEIESNPDFEGRLLWSGGSYLAGEENGEEALILSERVSEQNSGLCLVFSPCVDGAVQDYDFITRFVPKWRIAKHLGHSEMIFLCSLNFTRVGCKAVHIHDDRVTGYSGNVLNGANNGITFDNTGFVLRYIIGV